MGGKPNRDSDRQLAVATRRALLVDDERLSRAQLRAQLSRFPELEVVAEADCVPKAIDAVKEFHPDVVFLDIQMPGQTGFDFLERASGNFRVIFVTAYDRFALRAFEVNALDYLMKPVSQFRLAAAVHRLTDSAPYPPQPLAPLDNSDYLFVTSPSGARFVKVSSIKFITAAGPYSQLFTADGRSWMVLCPLKDWETRLPQTHFVRTHRSSIINLQWIDRLDDTGGGTYQAFLREHGTPVPVSRRYSAQMKERFR